MWIDFKKSIFSGSIKWRISWIEKKKVVCILVALSINVQGIYYKYAYVYKKKLFNVLLNIVNLPNLDNRSAHILVFF